MKKVYRYEDNLEYWDRRWRDASSDSDRFEDLTIYPIHYAEMVMHDRSARALEIGCGLGRVVKHYHRQGFNISGMERSQVAVDRLNAEVPELSVIAGDVLALPYEAGSFDVALSFGVYHNLETGLDEALAETARILRPGGAFVISMRPDNIEMNLNELYWRWRNRGRRSGEPRFHKLLVGENEFRDLLLRHGLRTDAVYHARNVSLLYRFPFLRSREVSKAMESKRRAAGYRLNAVGGFIDRLLQRYFSYETANVLVYVGRKIQS